MRSDSDTIHAEQEPMDGSSQKPSVPAMADLRLASAAIDALVKQAQADLAFIQRRTLIGDDAMNARQVCRALETLKSLADEAIKQKACSAGGTTPTSTPSP